MLPAFLTALFWSFSAVCSARTAKALGGTRANRWRLVLALGLLSVALGLAHAGHLPTWQPSAWWFVASGVIGLGLGDIALFHAYQRLGARIPALLTHCLGAPLAAVGEWYVLGTGLPLITCLMITVVLLGVAVALWPSSHDIRGHIRLTASGLLLGVLSAAGLACAALLSRHGYATALDEGTAFSWLDATWLRVIGGLSLCLLWLPFPARTTPEPANWRAGWPWLIGTATAGPAIGVALYQWALSLQPAGVVQAVVALVPVIIVPLTRLTEGDRPTPRSLIGAAIAVAGVIGLGLSRH